MNQTIVLVALLLAPLVIAEEVPESSLVNQSLAEAHLEFQELITAGLPHEKPSDLYEAAEESYVAQLAIEAEGGNATYEQIYTLLDDLFAVRQNTFAVADELTVLKNYLDAESKASLVDFTPAYKFYEDAQTEFNDERFMKARDLIDQSYEKVSELNAASTKAQALLSASTDKVGEFFKRTWKLLIVEIGVIIILFFVFNKTIKYQRIKFKIQRLNKERQVIDALTKESQKKYFEEAKMSESDYHIRMKKYGELIRDINRQIPLLQEELILLQKVKK